MLLYSSVSSPAEPTAALKATGSEWKRTPAD